MTDLIIHPKTQAGVDKFLQNPSQVLAVIGGKDAGDLKIAELIAAQILGIDTLKVGDHYKIIFIRRPADKQEIPIEEVRSLIKRVRIKAPGEGTIKRVVLIDEAQRLSPEAQNALLKTLEQPNPDTIFILTLGSAGGVLPTVMSRAVKLTVHPISLEQALKSYKNLSEADIETAWNISEGRATLLHQLLTDEESDLKAAIDLAKDFVSKDKYHRLLMVDELSKDRPALINFLEGLSKVLKAIHHAQIKRGRSDMSAKVLTARRQVSRASQAVRASASAKLALLNLVESLEV